MDHAFLTYFSEKFPYNFDNVRSLYIGHLRKAQIQNILAMCPAVENLHVRIAPARFRTWSKPWSYDFSANNTRLSEVTLEICFGWRVDLESCMTCVHSTLSSLPKASSLKIVHLKLGCGSNDYSWDGKAKELLPLLQDHSRKSLQYQFPMVDQLSKTFEKFETAGKRLVLYDLRSRIYLEQNTVYFSEEFE